MVWLKTKICQLIIFLNVRIQRKWLKDDIKRPQGCPARILVCTWTPKVHFSDLHDVFYNTSLCVPIFYLLYFSFSWNQKSWESDVFQCFPYRFFIWLIWLIFPRDCPSLTSPLHSANKHFEISAERENVEVQTKRENLKFIPNEKILRFWLKVKEKVLRFWPRENLWFKPNEK